MMFDEEANRLPVFDWERESRQQLVCHVQRTANMIAGCGAFADVVQEQSKAKQPGIFVFKGELAEARGSVRFSAIKTVDGFDGDERVLIHRVAVVEVAHDEAFDGVPLRKRDGKQAGFLHLAQSGGCMRLRHQVAPNSVAGRGGAKRGFQLRDGRLNLTLGVPRQQHAMAGNEGKQAEQRIG